jgi:regulator of RNase E activity RraB
MAESDGKDFYFCQVEGELASIFLDLGIAAHAPMPSRSIMGYVSLKMLQPRPDGLSSQEEFETLTAAEDDLTGTIVAGCGAVYVGRSTSAGHRDFYFYASDPMRFTQAAEDAVARYPAYRCAVGTAPDAGWSTYFEFLSPSSDDRQRMMNRHVRDALEARGDTLTEPRVIDHRAYFPDGYAAASFAAQIERLGFDVAPPKPMDAGKYAVDFERMDLPHDMDDLTPRLVALANELAGDYDGWGCTIVPATQD